MTLPVREVNSLRQGAIEQFGPLAEVVFLEPDDLPIRWRFAVLREQRPVALAEIAADPARHDGFLQYSAALVDSWLATAVGRDLQAAFARPLGRWRIVGAPGQPAAWTVFLSVWRDAIPYPRDPHDLPRLLSDAAQFLERLQRVPRPANAPRDPADALDALLARATSSTRNPGWIARAESARAALRPLLERAQVVAAHGDFRWSALRQLPGGQFAVGSTIAVEAATISWLDPLTLALSLSLESVEPTSSFRQRAAAAQAATEALRWAAHQTLLPLDMLPHGLVLAAFVWAARERDLLGIEQSPVQSWLDAAPRPRDIGMMPR